MDQPGVSQPVDVKPKGEAAHAGPRLSRWWRWPLGLGAVAALYTGVLGAWLPDFVRPRIEAAATQALGVPVALGELSLQPWTLTVAAGDVRLGPAESPWFTLKRAELRLSPESLWRMAPVVSRIELLSPRLTIERQSVDRLNISPMLNHIRSRPSSPSSGAPARFALYNIALRDGELRYTDRVLDQVHHVDHLKISLPFVSNLPSFVKVAVEPAMSARVDGSTLLIEGRTLPFSQGKTSVLDLSLQQLALKPLAEAAKPFLPSGWQVAVPDGELATTLKLQFEARAAPAVPSLLVQGDLTVNRLAVQARGLPGIGPVDAGWSILSVRGIETRPLEHQARVGSVALEGLRLAVNSPSSVTGPPVVAAPRRDPTLTAGAPSATTTPWSWQLGELRIQAPMLDVQTELAAAWPGLRDLSLRIKGLSAAQDAAPATWQLAWQDTAGTRFQADGDVQLAQAKAHAQLTLSQLPFLPWMAPVAQLPWLKAWPLHVREGTLDLGARVTAQWAPADALSVTLEQGQLALTQVRAQAASASSQDQIAWSSLKLDGIQAVLKAPGLQRVSADALTLQGLDARLTRDAQGRVLGFGGGTGLTPTQSSAQPRAQNRTSQARQRAQAPSPTFALGALRCQACQLRFTDRAVSPSAELTLDQAELKVEGLSQDLAQPLSVDFSARAQGPGQLSFKGQVRPQPLDVRAQLGVRNLELRAVQPYIDPMVNVSLAGAKAQANGRLQLADDQRKGLQARYQGALGLTDLRVLDRLNDADFLTWKALSLQGMDVTWRGGDLDATLGRITLQDFYGRVIVNPDGQLNLAQVLRQADAEAQSLTTPQTPGVPPSRPATAPDLAPVPVRAPSPAPSTTTATQAVPNAATPRIRWDQIQLSRGRIDFTDHFIQPNYSARMTQLEGLISAVSSAKPEPATVQVAGAIDDGAPLLISGQLHPLGPKLFTDIEGTAKGIELTRLTPYAARYAGYAIEKGTLSVKVHYKVDGGKLQAENQVFLDQLTFGDKTDSPDATSLPVRFAVSLLKNSKGEIDINLPISGSLDEPQFSVGGLIWKVFVNLIGKAVTAPFALLSGGGGDELGFVPFAPGSADLSAEARTNLAKLAASLSDRPGLKLEATGRADPVVDAEGLREAHLSRLITAAKARALKQDPAEVVVAPDEREQWLIAAYKAADIQKPRNLIGLSKTLPSTEMAALLKASAPADTEALLALANRRGDQVKAYLAARMPPERVLLTASKLGSQGLPADKGPPSRVQFEVR